MECCACGLSARVLGLESELERVRAAAAAESAELCAALSELTAERQRLEARLSAIEDELSRCPSPRGAASRITVPAWLDAQTTATQTHPAVFAAEDEGGFDIEKGPLPSGTLSFDEFRAELQWALAGVPVVDSAPAATQTHEMGKPEEPAGRGCSESPTATAAESLSVVDWASAWTQTPGSASASRGCSVSPDTAAAATSTDVVAASAATQTHPAVFAAEDEGGFDIDKGPLPSGTLSFDEFRAELQWALAGVPVVDSAPAATQTHEVGKPASPRVAAVATCTQRISLTDWATQTLQPESATACCVASPDTAAVSTCTDGMSDGGCRADVRVCDVAVGVDEGTELQLTDPHADPPTECAGTQTDADSDAFASPRRRASAVALPPDGNTPPRRRASAVAPPEAATATVACGTDLCTADASTGTQALQLVSTGSAAAPECASAAVGTEAPECASTAVVTDGALVADGSESVASASAAGEQEHDDGLTEVSSDSDCDDGAATVAGLSQKLEALEEIADRRWVILCDVGRQRDAARTRAGELQGELDKKERELALCRAQLEGSVRVAESLLDRMYGQRPCSTTTA
eukprot:TRINITY_DN2244_c0_g1_i1.p1 TRINITY_DN2244_c0_g1~~TRINITY_DN2244_c0_g1_i1.p1  ORF type:complete len:606 (+),score=152.08 TRINITY_DN2244_c0_g1_i1:76-1818(+)